MLGKLQLEIAKHLLGCMIIGDANRAIEAHEEDVRYSLKLADELIRQSNQTNPPSYDYSPPMQPPPQAMMRKIERPLGDLLKERRSKEQQRPRKGPTLH
ncbi:MAG: hypothetical protein JSS25_04435 [Proteobacteria bacterium]|nr:hypothetical protein [Pseudomonadota bacterium]